jgi:hypothetical protein
MPRTIGFVLVAALTCSTAGAANADAANKLGRTRYRTWQSAGWTVIESPNFRFCCAGRLQVSDQMVEATEKLRTDLAEKWLGGAAAWQPKCDLVLHATSAAYLRAVPGGEQTAGCALIEAEGGKMVRRRIDIRADKAGWHDAALAHELTHVVLADLFPDAAVPAWADEGMAVLADPAPKQNLHLRDLRIAQRHRATFRLVELFSLDGYPPHERHAALYGQSSSLVRFLVARGTPERFARFVRAASDHGHDQALRDLYGIQGVEELERRWLRHVSQPMSLAKGSR